MKELIKSKSKLEGGEVRNEEEMTSGDGGEIEGRGGDRKFKGEVQQVHKFPSVLLDTSHVQ